LRTLPIIVRKDSPVRPCASCAGIGTGVFHPFLISIPFLDHDRPFVVALQSPSRHFCKICFFLSLLKDSGKPSPAFAYIYSFFSLPDGTKSLRDSGLLKLTRLRIPMAGVSRNPSLRHAQRCDSLQSAPGRRSVSPVQFLPWNHEVSGSVISRPSSMWIPLGSPLLGSFPLD